jgi:PEP-CTERM motif
VKSMPSTYRTAILFALAGCLSLACAYQSKATPTTETFTFDACNIASLCNQGSAGVTLLADGTLSVSITTLGAYTFDEVGINGVTGLTFSSISNGFTLVSAKNLDGLGTFAYVLDGGSAAASVNSLTFIITCPSGCTLASVTGFGGHIINLSAGVTGFAASGPPGVVPEPVSMLLFGSGLVAIGAKIRHRNRKSRNPVAA